MTKGWHGDRHKHSLASRGIRTSRGIEYSHHWAGRDYYEWTCGNCGRSKLIQEGEDVAYCPCEFEDIGREHNERMKEFESHGIVEFDTIKYVVLNSLKELKDQYIKDFDRMVEEYNIEHEDIDFDEFDKLEDAIYRVEKTKNVTEIENALANSKFRDMDTPKDGRDWIYDVVVRDW